MTVNMQPRRNLFILLLSNCRFIQFLPLGAFGGLHPVGYMYKIGIVIAYEYSLILLPLDAGYAPDLVNAPLHILAMVELVLVGPVSQEHLEEVAVLGAVGDLHYHVEVGGGVAVLAHHRNPVFLEVPA